MPLRPASTSCTSSMRLYGLGSARVITEEDCRPPAVSPVGRRLSGWRAVLSLSEAGRATLRGSGQRPDNRVSQHSEEAIFEFESTAVPMSRPTWTNGRRHGPVRDRTNASGATEHRTTARRSPPQHDRAPDTIRHLRVGWDLDDASGACRSYRVLRVAAHRRRGRARRNQRGRPGSGRCTCHHGPSCGRPLARRSSFISRSVACTSCSSLDTNAPWIV